MRASRKTMDAAIEALGGEAGFARQHGFEDIIFYAPKSQDFAPWKSQRALLIPLGEE